MDLATVRGIEHSRRVCLAVDAMGGDHAPDEVVAGALLYAAENPDDEVILVGVPARIAEAAGAALPPNVTVEAASQVIEMHEHPALALREKKDASILVACDLVKRGRADAVITAGHTGAGMTAAVLRLGRIRGVDRPALAIQMVTETGPLVLLDIGANPDSTPENLAQYAHMGALFAERALGIDRPRVALLSIGEEKGKGDVRIQRASALLDASGLNFTGNVEGQDLVHHPADVVVCDAVLGNVTIKFFEGLATFIFDLWAKEFRGSLRGRIAYLLMRPGVARIRRTFDYEALGGSPLLGVRGTVVITHGRAKRRMVSCAIGVGAAAARARLPELIGDAFRSGPGAGGFDDDTGPAPEPTG
ncbi:MAG TPA: phosphate acyltransferase PlsX [Patescibacteria group bacterium]|nr:phosphate acyltransferase PlsX [Patescibacteria group bacterium]